MNFFCVGVNTVVRRLFTHSVKKIKRHLIKPVILKIDVSKTLVTLMLSELDVLKGVLLI